MKVEFSAHIFEIYSNIQFHENSSTSGSGVVQCEQANRHDEAITASLNFSNAPKNDPPPPSPLSEVVSKACRRLCVRLSDFAEHSGALHYFDSLIPVLLQRVIRGAGNIVAVRNSSDIPTMHVRVLLLTVPIYVLNF
jgi:hypothetical protein